MVAMREWRQAVLLETPGCLMEQSVFTSRENFSKEVRGYLAQ